MAPQTMQTSSKSEHTLTTKFFEISYAVAEFYEKG